MTKTILITGATDGIGLDAATRLLEDGHRVLLHGRNPAKLETVRTRLGEPERTEGFVADFSRLDDVAQLARAVAQRHTQVDVLINNAGVFRTPVVHAEGGLDIRFVVNTVAPYLLTRRLLPQVPADGRIINLSSAAQAPVDLDQLCGRKGPVPEQSAYAQSKLAITAWTRYLAHHLEPQPPLLVSVNPGSLLGTKMVNEAFGVSGSDIGIGGEILRRAATSPRFAKAHGAYFDNDGGDFAESHPSALDDGAAEALIAVMDELISDRLS